MTVGCGSTAVDGPTAPSPASPGTDYPSVRGEWINDGSLLVLRYRDTPVEYSCNARLGVLAQTEATFSGSGSMQGGSPESDRACTSSFSFAAEMTRDGRITSFRPDRSLGVGSCTPLSEATVSGVVTSDTMRIQLTDRASCPDEFGGFREADRTLTISVKRWPPNNP